MPMDVRITPAPLRGRVEVMPSKSAAHRILILAALADRPTRVELGQSNGDIDATARCLRALGAAMEFQGEGVLVTPAKGPPNGEALLDCGESGSTLRFMMPVAAALGARARFTGAGRLPARPIGLLGEQLASHGCRVEGEGLPLTLSGRLTAGRYTLPGDVSSQYVTGLLLALPLLPGDSLVTLTSPLQSAGYVTLTMDAMKRFGVTVDEGRGEYRVPGGQRYTSPGSIAVEGDWSGGAFWLAAGALGGPIACGGLEPRSAQGDREMASLMAQMGAAIHWEEGSVTSRRGTGLSGITVDGRDIPDLIPALAAAAATARGTTAIINAARLRDKESDRLAALCRELSALGADITEQPDGLVIRGKPFLAGGEADGWGDHRIVMALAVAACASAGPVLIRGAGAVEKSYPRFFDHYRELGGKLHVL